MTSPPRGLSKTSRKLVVTSALALLLTIGGKLVAFGRDVSLSVFFGASVATDAFFIANMIPGILWAAFFATINIVFLPMYVRARENGTAADALATEAVQIYSLLGVALGVLCALGAGEIARQTAPGAPAETIALAGTLTVLMAAGFVFSGYVGVQNAIQQAHGLYLAPLAVPLVNNLIAIAGIVVAAYYSDIRIAVIAAVLAWVVQAPIQRLQTRRFYRTAPRFVISSQTLRTLTLLSVPVMLGTFLDQINIFVGMALASGFGEGAISQLNYASRLALFLATTFSMFVSYFLFPRLAQHAAQDDDEGTASVLGAGILLVFAITMPLIALSIELRHDIVAIVYGQGALNDQGRLGTASALAYYAAGIVFIALRELLNRLFFSHQRNVAPLVIGVFASIANVGASYWLSQTMGIAGIALGASVSALVYFAAQVGLVLIWKPQLIQRRLLLGLLGVIAATVPAWAVLSFALPMLVDLPPLMRIVAGGLVFTLPFFAILAPLARQMGFLHGHLVRQKD